MNRRTLAISTLTLLLALAAGTAAPASAQGGWQLELFGTYLDPTAADSFDGSFGGGVSLERRATPLLGFALGVMTADLEGETRGDFIGFEVINELEVGLTPIVGRLDFHLTPDRRADFYLGPVLGYVLMDDVVRRVRVTLPGPIPVEEEARYRADDQLAWGAHAGVDLPLGNAGGRSYLTAGVTWLDLPLEFEAEVFDRETNEVVVETVRSDLDPLIVHLGFGFRF